MSNQSAPLGPGHNNITNYNGSPLSYFQRSDQQLTGECVSTTFYALVGTATAYETSLEEFTHQLGRCSFFVQGYDNSHLACFGALRVLDNHDLTVLNQYFNTGYGAMPYGKGGYGGTYAYHQIFSELCYVYQDPTYASDSLSSRVVDLLLQAQSDFNADDTRRVLCVVPTTIPTGTQYDWVRYLTSDAIALTGVRSTSQGATTTGGIQYHNIATTANLMNLVK